MTRHWGTRAFVVVASLALCMTAAAAADAQVTPPAHPAPVVRGANRSAAAPALRTASVPSVPLATTSGASRHRRQRLGAVAGAVFVVLALTLWSFDFGLLGGRISPLSRPLTDRRSRHRPSG